MSVGPNVSGLPNDYLKLSVRVTVECYAHPKSTLTMGRTVHKSDSKAVSTAGVLVHMS